MNLRRLWAISRKEFIHVFRDARSLILSLALPAVLLILFGYALKLDVENVPLAVWDESGTPRSRDFISMFTSSRYFSLQLNARNYREVERAIETGDAQMALVIPSDFADVTGAGKTAHVQVIVDGSDPNTALISTSYATAIAASASAELSTETLNRLGVQSQGAPLDVRPRVWFNTDMESKNFIIPGLIAIIMMVIAGLLTSLTVAREWERGTMEQLISTPVKGSELILGKMIPYFAVGMADVVIAAMMGEFVFGVPLRGSVLLLFSISAVFLVGALSMGIVISVTAKTQLMANQVALLATFLPAFLLSGFAFPISNMPVVINALTYLVPARYFIVVLRAIYLKGLGIPILAGEMALLSVFALVMLTLAMKRFVKKLT